MDPELVRRPSGRNVVFFTSILLAIPCIWMALALSDGGTSYLQVIIAAGFSGVGGGAFASSMANITPFSPKRMNLRGAVRVRARCRHTL